MSQLTSKVSVSVLLSVSTAKDTSVIGILDLTTGTIFSGLNAHICADNNDVVQNAKTYKTSD